VLTVVDISTVSIVIASSGVLVAAIYYALQIRHQTRLRQTDLIMRLFSHFGSKEFQESWQKIMSSEFRNYDDYVKKYGKADAWGVFMLFEGMGLLVHRELAYFDVVDELVSGPIKSTWEKMKPIIEGYRKQYDQPQFCEWFEYLYNEMERRGKRLKYGKRKRLQQSKA
jgi:hypothetical protein